MPQASHGPNSRATSIRVGIAGHLPEALGLAFIVLVAAYLRLNNLQAGADWDSDQGGLMLALRDALHSGSLPQLGMLASPGTFHHGALYLDLMLPAAWLGNGDPTPVLFETALTSLAVVPMVWWVARSIAGTAAGLAAALLAATSGGLVFFSGFIWNPTVMEPGAALALLGAWQAWSGRKPAWLPVAAAGTAISMQADLAGIALFVPMACILIALLVRGPAGRRRHIALWGAAAAAVIVVTYVPFIFYELGHRFAETHAIVAYLTGPTGQASHSLAYRLAVGPVRILAWPLTGWPLWGQTSGLVLASAVSVACAAGLVWRLVATARPRIVSEAGPTNDPAEADDPLGAAARERDGTRLIVGSLAALTAALVFGLANLADLKELTEQYHIVADPFVIVAAGILLGSLWRLRPSRAAGALGRAAKACGPLVCLAILAGLVWQSAAQWPSGTTPFSWSAAQSAASRLEGDASGKTIALVGLTGGRSTDTYLYPLVSDGARVAAPDRTTVLVVLCDTSVSASCGGSQEDAWLATQTYAAGFVLVDRFEAAPGRMLSVYEPGAA
jgi:hypothetical protein